MDCGNCARHVSPDWRGRLCPYCGATLYALPDATMNVATAALALVFGAALVMMGRG